MQDQFLSNFLLFLLDNMLDFARSKSHIPLCRSDRKLDRNLIDTHMDIEFDLHAELER